MVTVALRSDLFIVPRWIMPVHDDAEPALTFGQVIESERLARGWSQEHVAAAIGVRQGKISEYENDKKSDPPALNVAALEDLFGKERGELAALLWGERVRAEFRRLFARSNIYAITPDSPPAVHDLIEDIAVLEPEDIEELREEARRLRRGHHNGRE